MRDARHWGWNKDEDGYWKLPDLVAEFVAWYTNPEKPDGLANVAQWAKAHGKDPSVAHHWKQDKRVRDNLEKRLDELNISPDRVQQVVDAMFKRACSGDTNAAKLYLQFIEKLAPPRVIVEDKRVTEMSDAELAKQLDAARGSLHLSDD